MSIAEQSDTEPGYAMTIANDSYEWYRSHAIRSRRSYRTSGTAILLMSVAIPVSVAISPDATWLTALLGGAAAFVSGLESIFHWRDNYLRYTQAREAVEAERRRYNTGQRPYADPSDRDQVLVSAVTAIEQREMGRWLRAASPRSAN